jgi:integrase
MGVRAAGLTAAKVKTAPTGRYGDGDGLYLLVRSPTSAFWVFRFTRAGRMREMGLGRARGQNAVALVDARAKAGLLHQAVVAGRDPLADREAAEVAAKAAAQTEAAQRVTFRAAAAAYIGSHEAAWKNAKHRYQWQRTLEVYAYPHFGDVAVADVATPHVLAALEPVWRTKMETAGRLRGRIEAVLDYAKARQWRAGENPATWRGHLIELLPSHTKIAQPQHHAALPWAEVAAFLEKVRGQAAVAARALEFAILTAARTGEVLGARWREIDLDAKVWTVSADRMKAGREHRVPLSDPAVAVLVALRGILAHDPDAYVFPGTRESKPLSNMAMIMLLRRMKRGDLTAHGFRSTFRDWVSERTGYPREVAEAALAHLISDKVEAAYRRGDLFEKRRKLMREWAAFCGGRAQAQQRLMVDATAAKTEAVQ